MPKYTYIAKSQPNQTIQGEIEADSEQEVINKLTRIGYFPIAIKIQDILSEKRMQFARQRVAKREIALFTRQLATLIKSGVNIINSLTIVSAQISNRYLKSLISDVIGKVKDGRALSDSLATHPSVFSNLYTSMIHSGEIGGTLEVTAERLADFLEKEEEFKNSVKTALTYPLFVLIVGCAIIVILMTFVIPRLVTMFEDMGQILPLPTRVLIALSQFLQGYGWLLLTVLVLLTFIFQRFRQSTRGRIIWDGFKLRVALWGQIISKTEISHLVRTLSLLLSGGIPIISALEVSSSVVANSVIQTELKGCIKGISGGLRFSDAIRGSKLFPEFVIQVITIGEETGALDKALLRMADEYEREVERTLKTLTRFIEPLIILTIGLIVGFIVLAMLLPIFQINLLVR